MLSITIHILFVYFSYSGYSVSNLYHDVIINNLIIKTCYHYFTIHIFLVYFSYSVHCVSNLYHNLIINDVVVFSLSPHKIYMYVIYVIFPVT